MIKKLKFFAASAIVLIASLGFVTPVQAGPVQVTLECESPYIGIAPFWSHTASIAVQLNFNRPGVATMGGVVIGNHGVSHIVVDAELERINPNGTRTVINRWNNIRMDGSVWHWSRDHNVARGHSYRLALIVRTHRNGQVETIVAHGPIVHAH